jgi:hypothetical protein
MKQFTLLFILFFSVFSFAQQEEVKNYEWDEKPIFKLIPVEFEKYPAVVLKDFRLNQNRASQYSYKGFVVKHVAIQINTDEGINEFNKVSINKKYVRDYRDLKARVIKPNGEIVLLPNDKIIENDKTDEKQFVFESVEKGDILEYYYVIKDMPDFSGVEYFQRTIPVLEAKFQINKSVAAGSTFAFGYNGMKNESSNKYHIYTATNLPAFKEEINAINYANLAKVYFYSDANSKYNYYSYYNSLVTYANGTNAKSMIKDFIKDQKLDDPSISLDDRLKKMDIYLKENIKLEQQYNYKKVFDDKKISSAMVLYLYKDVLDLLKVKYNFVVSTNRFDDKLDKVNVVPATLSEILIYIPETKKYLSPFYYWMPYGSPNSDCVDNDAISFETTKSKTEYKFIKVNGVSMDDNIVDTSSEIIIDDDMETVSVNKKMAVTGYRSYYYRNVMKYIKEDKIKDYIKDEVFEDIDVDLKKYEIKNKEYKFNYDKENPFTFETQTQIKEAWVENAGKNYLFSIGKVLGKQTDLYQETERKQDIDLYYPKKYIHAITFNIPKGYVVKSVSNLILNKQIKNDDNEVIGSFVSNAKIQGNTIQINIEEFYNFTHLEKEKYNDYRSLINTAFDFYKSSVVLSK